jgi:hypothetical protein
MRNNRGLQTIDLLRNRSFVHLRINSPKRLCVTTVAGMIDGVSWRTVRTFEDREAMEEFVERKVERKARVGFEQVA